MPANQKSSLEELKTAVEELYACRARHLRSVLVHESAEGKTLWLGEVEVFILQDHPQGQRCYAWWHRLQQIGKPDRLVAILEAPDATSPREAVQSAIRAHLVSADR